MKLLRILCLISLVLLGSFSETNATTYYKKNDKAKTLISSKKYVVLVSYNDFSGYLYYNANDGTFRLINADNIDFTDGVDKAYMFKVSSATAGLRQLTSFQSKLGITSAWTLGTIYTDDDLWEEIPANLLVDGDNPYMICQGDELADEEEEIYYWLGVTETNDGVGSYQLTWTEDDECGLTFEFYELSTTPDGTSEKKTYAVIYNYIDEDGNNVGSEKFTVTSGDKYPTPQSIPYGYVLSSKVPSGTITKRTSLYLTVKVDASLENYTDGKYYFLDLSGKYLYDSSDEDYMNVGTNGKVKTITDGGSVWTFSGDAVNGYEIKNLKGEYLYVNTSNITDGDGKNTYPCVGSSVPGASTNKWYIEKSGDGFYISPKSAKNYYLSVRSGKLALRNEKEEETTLVTRSRELPAVSMNSVGEFSYASVYLPYAVSIPTDGSVKAYTLVMDSSEGGAKWNEVTSGIIPAETGVVLQGQSQYISSVILTMTDDNSAVYSDISGTLVDMEINDNNRSNYFQFGKYKDENGKYQVGYLKIPQRTTKLKANRTYVEAEKMNSSSVAQYINFGDDTISGIDNVTDNEGENDAELLYDLSGRKVNNANLKGVFITADGKKVVVSK